MDETPLKLYFKRGIDNYSTHLVTGSSLPNRQPYRVTQAQQEEIAKKTNKFVCKGMSYSCLSPFFPPLLLVHKKDGIYRMYADYHTLKELAIKRIYLKRCKVLSTLIYSALRVLVIR